MLASAGNKMYYERLQRLRKYHIVCVGYPVENLQVEGVSSFQHTLVFQDLQRHVGHVRICHRDAVLPQTPVW